MVIYNSCIDVSNMKKLDIEIYIEEFILMATFIYKPVTLISSLPSTGQLGVLNASSSSVETLLHRFPLIKLWSKNTHTFIIRQVTSYKTKFDKTSWSNNQQFQHLIRQEYKITLVIILSLLLKQF